MVPSLHIPQISARDSAKQSLKQSEFCRAAVQLEFQVWHLLNVSENGGKQINSMLLVKIGMRLPA
jgi:hypothetical protein